MANNRDDKYEGSDDEYHFSDDEEVSYEVENETQQATPSPSKTSVSRFGKRRMMISFAVFLAIVVVVYKFISPSSTTPPPTELAATPIPQTNTVPAPKAVVMQQAPVPAKIAPAVEPSQTQAAASLPAVIPVQSDESSQGQSPAAAMSSYIDDKSKGLNEASLQAISAMEAHYSQKLNQFNEQNKNLQNQVQTLSSRVADMEAQINQLVQVLTRRSHAAATQPAVQPVAVEQQQPAVRAAEVKVAYNVQAIIPGRAWLKAENGETVTVAEGDMIRNVGRVTKIDPYDGVVEINTGSKAISLSYGNGG